MTPPVPLPASERCLQAGPECKGPVEMRWTPDRTDLQTFPRCDFHYQQRLAQAEEHNRKYPLNPPDDFDPSYAGESWDED